QMSILRACNHGLSAVANVFERHQSGFHFDDASIPIIYLLLFIGGASGTFSWAARSSFFPTLVPRDAFSNAVTWNNSIFQIGSVAGPAISGFVVAHRGFPIFYIIDAITAFAFFLLVLPILCAKPAKYFFGALPVLESPPWSSVYRKRSGYRWQCCSWPARSTA